MPKHTSHNQASQRQLRVAELIRHAVSEVLTRGDIVDDVLTRHVITVPEVRMSPDLKNATVYVMPLGGGDVQPIIKALASHASYLRGQISRRITMKFTPNLRFRMDETFDYAGKIDTLLRSPEVSRDLEHPLPHTGDDQDQEPDNQAADDHAGDRA